METKHIVLLVAVVLIAVGGVAFVTQNEDAQDGSGSSTAGATFNSAKVAAVAVAPATPGTGATSTSVYNSDASDRYITGLRVGCSSIGTSLTAYTGAGLANLTLTIATSSTNAPATNSNTAHIFPTLNIATTTGFFTVSSTTGAYATTSLSGAIGYTGSTSFRNLWTAGSYVSFFFNATNTAACTVGVDYLPG